MWKHEILRRREQLVRALRSGNYEQAQSRLKVGTRFCCLGVACNLFGLQMAEEGAPIVTFWGSTPSSPSDTHFTALVYGLGGEVSQASTDSAVLPLVVAEWYGLTTNPRPEGLVDRHGRPLTLTELNDNGFTFGQIADIIEHFWVFPLQAELDTD